MSNVSFILHLNFLHFVKSQDSSKHELGTQLAFMHSPPGELKVRVYLRNELRPVINLVQLAIGIVLTLSHEI